MRKLRLRNAKKIAQSHTGGGGSESGSSPGLTLSTTRRPSPGRSKGASLSDQTGLMRSPGGPSVCPDSSLSLRKPPPLPSLPCTWASGPKTAYSQFNTRVLQKQITQRCRLIQRNSHGICPQIASHRHIMCTDIYKLVPTRVHTHVHFHPMDIDACAHRSCTDTKPHIHIHIFIPTQQT